MLFISILLSIWFVLWLMKTSFVRDAINIITSWVNDVSGEDEEDEEKLYTIICNHCKHMWWSEEPIMNYCPKCGQKPND